MELLERVRQSWGWVGLNPAAVVEVGAFGNLLVRDTRGSIWRVSPEDLSCSVVANDEAAYRALRSDPEFSADWDMASLVALARVVVGPLEAGRSYCLKVPAPLGGAYDEGNLASIETGELIAVSGEIARQAHELPDGTQVQLRIIE